LIFARIASNQDKIPQKKGNYDVKDYKGFILSGARVLPGL
jgi:hypothetical protein